VANEQTTNAETTVISPFKVFEEQEILTLKLKERIHERI